MDPSRRTLLRAGTALLVVSCGPGAGVLDSRSPPSDATDPNTPPDTGDTGDVDPGYVWHDGHFETPAPDTTLFPSGVQAGDPSHDSVVVSVRTTAANLAIVVVLQEPDRYRFVLETPLEPGALGHQVLLTDLEPGQRYRWAVRDADRWSRMGHFRTAPAPDALPVFSFGATSCLGGNQPWPELSWAAEQDLDLFVFLGDTVYADWGPDEPLANKWRDAMAQAGMRDLTASTAVVATWDDHEVWNNWSPQLTPQAQIDTARSLFRGHLPQRTGPNGGIWRSVRWGRTAELFVLDCRSERALFRYMSDAQLDWLVEGLQNSPCAFKIIVNSVPATDLSFIPVAGLIEAADRWQGYPVQRDRLMNAVGDTSGVLFISGDFHVGGAARVEPAGRPASGVVEVLCGPGGSAVSSVYGFLPTGPRLPRLVPELNVTRFVCDPATMQIEVEWVNAQGGVIRSFTVDLA